VYRGEVKAIVDGSFRGEEVRVIVGDSFREVMVRTRVEKVDYE
jgi:hypothetical protein